MIVDIDQSDLGNFLNITERGSDSIVFQFGSHSVKFGLASQLTPFVIPNCIAYKKIEMSEINTLLSQNENHSHHTFYVDGDDQMNVDSDTYISRPEITESFLSNLLNIEQETIKKQIKLEQRLKLKKMPNSNKSFMGKNFENSESDIPERKNYEGAPSWTTNLKKSQAIAADLNEDIIENNYKWTSISNEPSFLIGREALTIKELNKYIIRHPIKYGFFNNEYSYHGVLDDLQKIIEFCVINILQIKKSYFGNFNIVLIIPDLYVKQQVKGMINVFLRNLNFKAIFIHTESVMSTFGAAMQSSCVVDIGSSKINVCCTDEGMIIEESLLRKNFGGDDITTLMYMILSRKSGNNSNLQSHAKINFPIDYFDLNNPYHFRIIEKLKEGECEFPSIQNPSSQFIPKSTKIWLHRKHQTTKLFNVNLTEAIYVPPLSLIYPEIFESFRNVTIPYLNYYNDIYTEVYTDPEDVMDDLIKNLITNEKDKEKAEKAERDGTVGLQSSIKKSKLAEDDDSLSMSPSRSEENSSQQDDEKNQKIRGMKNTYENMFKLISIEEMICESIMGVENPELRKRLSNSILLVGGGAKFKGIIDYLEDRLIDKLTTIDPLIERVEIINFPTVDSKTITWIGGTIIPKLDSSKDMWITRDRWVLDIDRLDEKEKDLAPNKEIKENQSVTGYDNESKKEEKFEDTIQAQKNEKSKKKEKHLDGGVNLIREKCPFQW